MNKLVTLACACALTLAMPICTAAQARAKPSGLDQEYLTTSMKGDLFEVAGGIIALRRSHNAAVDKLARRLISDHTQSFRESAKLARKLGVDVPTKPTASQTWELRIMARLHTGHTFNQWYASLESYDHVQDISETTDEVKDGKLAEVRKDARHELPMLYMHLALARQTLTAVH